MAIEIFVYLINTITIKDLSDYIKSEDPYGIRVKKDTGCLQLTVNKSVEKKEVKKLIRDYITKVLKNSDYDLPKEYRKEIIKMNIFEIYDQGKNWYIDLNEKYKDRI